jgi:hypothetical protein
VDTGTPGGMHAALEAEAKGQYCAGVGKRLTGISVPFGGLQWETVDGDKQIARRVIVFLENRRVLFNAHFVEDERDCVRSALAIREFVTEQLAEARPGATVEGLLRSIRAACRRFVDRAGRDGVNFHRREGGPTFVLRIDAMSLALGDLRTTVGFAVAALAERFDLVVEDDLAQILPPPVNEDDASWLPGFDA